MKNTVDVSIKNNIGWVTINNPPVNTTSTSVREGLLKAVDTVKNCALAVLQCEGRTFVAGGDMSEFDAAPEEPHLPDVVNAIEASTVPFLAILHGKVLGGGFEIAMACAFRLAKPSTRFGLPEVNVGLIPGAGGTQRAPRLLGWDMSIDMACSGLLKTADDLLSVGAIDAISEEPETIVSDYLGKSSRRISEINIEQPDTDTLEKYRSKITIAAKGKKAPSYNLNSLLWAVEPFSDAQPKERALHLELRQSNESRALRHIFFAERAVTKPAIIEEGKPVSLEAIAIVGGGLMGCGIAVACLNGGYNVCIIERNNEAAENAKLNVIKLLKGGLERGKMSETQFESRCASFASSSDYQTAENADLAIEAVFEDVNAKREIFDQLIKVMRPDAILATNTSYLDPNQIFSNVKNLNRCVGIHFFSPAHIMKLVEVVRMEQTSADTLATAFSLAAKLRKTPVISGICDGFIGNRILAAYRRAAEYLLADGALPQQVDTAMKSYGMAMGPFEAQDMSGLQIAEANRRRQDASRDPSERYVPISDRLCADGRTGQRAGQGWYSYENESRKPVPDDEVERIIFEYAAEQRIIRQNFSDKQIQLFLLAAMANEGALIVDEGIAENEAAIDVVKIAGYGFPRQHGGPMYWARTVDLEEIRSALKALAKASPHSWKIADRFQNN